MRGAEEMLASDQERTLDWWRGLVARSGLRVMWCGYCAEWCLAEKRSLCCGDAVYDGPSPADLS